MGLVDRGRLPAPLTKLFNIGRSYSMWVYQWGLACCAIEMGAAFGSPRYDVMRLGVIPLPASPRQADLVVVSGTVTDKMAPAVKRLVRADARAKVRHLDGFVRELWRPLLGFVFGDKGCRPDRSGRCVRARLPSSARGSFGRRCAPAAAHQARRYGCPLAWRGLQADCARE